MLCGVDRYYLIDIFKSALWVLGALQTQWGRMKRGRPGRRLEQVQPRREVVPDQWGAVWTDQNLASCGG